MLIYDTIVQGEYVRLKLQHPSQLKIQYEYSENGDQKSVS